MFTLHPQKLQAACTYIDSWLDINFRNSRFTGMQVAILHQDKILYSRAFGYANITKKQPMTTKHAMCIASHSKTFTATAIMQLVEAKKLRLDEPVSQYLPWFMSKKDPRVAQVTIRQLLNHTSGLARDGDDANYWELKRDFPLADELKAYINQCQLFYNPDEIFKYSNYGYGYLGQVIEAVSKLSYANYIEQYIIRPLGLQHTAPDYNHVKSPIALGYGSDTLRQKRPLYKPQTTHSLAPAAGVYSTAEDLCYYFAGHFFNDNRLLSDQTKRIMQHGNWQPQSNENMYGLGIVSHPKKGWQLRGHGSSFIGYLSAAVFDPEKKFALAVITNANGCPAALVRKKLLNIVDTFQQDTDHITLPVTSLKPFEGRFRSLWGMFDIVAVGNKIFALDALPWGDFSSAEQLEVIDKKTLKVTHTSGFNAPGQYIKYLPDEDSIDYGGLKLKRWP